MPDTEVAPAAEPQAEPKKPMTRAEAVAIILAKQEEAFNTSDYNERLAVAKRKGLKLVEDPSYIPTIEELKAAVPLKRDRWNYVKLAKNSNGLLSVPKPQGRRKPHMTKKSQDIKSAALRIFKGLVADKAERIKAVCAKEGFEYLGIPDSAIPALGAEAAKRGMKEVHERRRAKNRKARRRQKFSRRTNANIPPRTSEKSYVEKGGQYGR